MEDFYDEDLDDYFNNPESLVNVMPQDEHEEYQLIQEELYQKAFEAEFERATTFKENIFSNSNLINKEQKVTDKSLTPSGKKRKMDKHGDKTPRSTKKHKSARDDSKNQCKSYSEDEVICINQIEDNPSNENKIKSSSKNQSLKNIIEDAGLTMNDLQAFIDDDNNSNNKTNGGDSDDNSDYIVISETSESGSDVESVSTCDDDDDDDIDVNIVNSMSKDDCTLSKILDSLPDNSSWNISSSDIIGQSISSVPRFHNLMKRVRCMNCNDKGHHTYLCPNPKKLSKCILCGDSGHQYRNCPDQLCFKCDQPGHSARDCDERIASYYDRCRRCSVRGHFEEKCPDSWRQYHLTVSEGNILRERDICKDGIEKKEKIRSCYNCGEVGHLGHVCQESRMDKYQSVSSPYIFRYDKQVDKDDNREKNKHKKETFKSSPRKNKARDSHKETIRSRIDEPRRFRETSREDNFIKTIDLTSIPTKKSFNRRDDSHSWTSANDAAHNSQGEPKKFKSGNVVPLMDLSLSELSGQACSSTPLPRNSNARPKKQFIEPDSFPREISKASSTSTPFNSRQKTKTFNFISPISPSTSIEFDASPERHIDSYTVNESELQNSYYGSKQMKKARRKQTRKEKKLMIKNQMQEAKDSNPKLAKQWWAVQKSQQFESLEENNSSSKKKKSIHVSRRISETKTKNLNQSFKKNLDSLLQSVPRRKRKSGELSFGDHKNNNITPRGFRLGTFQ